MVRSLKHHEKKLLKKVDFISWKSDNSLREMKIVRKYQLQKREDYTKYNKISGMVKSLMTKLRDLNPKDPYRIEVTNLLLEKLYTMGVISSRKSLGLCEKVSVSAFCRRRLPVVMIKNKMLQSVKDAAKFVEQGHVRIGPESVTDPALLVTRNMEDFITWTDTSKIRRQVQEYKDEIDDYDLMT